MDVAKMSGGGNCPVVPHGCGLCVNVKADVMLNKQRRAVKLPRMTGLICVACEEAACLRTYALG